MIIEIPEQMMFYLPYAGSAFFPLAIWVAVSWALTKRRGTRLYNRVLDRRRDEDNSTCFTVYRVDEDGDIISIWCFNDAGIARTMEKSERAKGVCGRLYHNNKLMREW